MSRSRPTVLLIPRWRACRSLLVAVTCLWPLLAGMTQASPGRVNNLEYRQVVAAYLINFIRYIEWPQSTPHADQPWRLGILRVEGIAEPLRAAVSQKTIRGHPIEVIYAETADALTECQIVFLPASASLLPQEVAQFTGRPVATVTYREPNEIAPATSIEMIRVDESIRYRLNTQLLAEHGLKPTAGLLENALPPSTSAPRDPL